MNVEIRDTIYDRLLDLQGVLQKEYGNDKEKVFEGRIDISDTLQFLFHELYHYTILKNFLYGLPSEDRRRLFEIIARNTPETQAETERSLLPPFLNASNPKIPPANFAPAIFDWRRIMPNDTRSYRDFIKK